MGGLKSLVFSWNEVDADHYKLLKNPDGISGYSQIGNDINTTSVNENVSAHLMNWSEARYIVQACNSAGYCSDSEPIAVAELMLDIIGYLKEPNINSYQQFGYGVAVSGDGSTLAVINGSGSLYLYELRDGHSDLLAEITAPQNAEFSPYISISSDAATLAITGYTDTDGDAQKGAVFIYIRDDQDWSRQAIVMASNGEMRDGFGADLSLFATGDVLAVAAPYESSNAAGINGDQSDNSAEYSGAAYIFIRSNTEWRQQAYIKASDNTAGNQFANALHLSSDGSTLAVGAQRAPRDTTRTGAVYLFVSEGDSWNQQTIITANNADRLDYFGCDVALSADGNFLAVGAYGEASYSSTINIGDTYNGLIEAGAAYLFKRTSSSWSQETYFKASVVENNDLFGWKVSLSSDGSLLAVSAKGDDSNAIGINGDQTDNSASDSGAVYLFRRQDPTTWVQHAYIKVMNTDDAYVEHDYGEFGGLDLETDGFGDVIALSYDGETLVVGAPREASSNSSLDQDNDAAPLAGAVYLY
ncbi:MAG: FG-GAP repeat protein [Candidatus Thiodiazotropha sp.]